MGRRLAELGAWVERLWTRTWIRRSLTFGFLGLVTLFLARYFARQYEVIRGTPILLRPLPFVLSIVLFWGFMGLGAVNWYFLMRFVNARVPFSQALKVWSISYLGRYVPGKVGILASRLLQHAGDRNTQKRVALAFILEALIGLLASLLVFTMTVGELLSGEGMRLQMIVLVGFAAGLVLVHPRLMERGLNLILRRMGRPPARLPLRWRDVISLLLLSLSKWAFLGLGFLFLARSVWPLSFHHALYLTGAYSFASIAGLAAVFAPSGLGVTEGVVVFALKNIVPGAIAVVIAVAARVWKVGSELLFIGIVWLGLRGRGAQAALQSGQAVHTDALPTQPSARPVQTSHGTCCPAEADREERRTDGQSARYDRTR